MSTFKCLDKLTAKNKCPEKKNPNKTYCDTRTGKCYTATKSGAPHGFKKQREIEAGKGENLVYDEKYKLFGYGLDIEKHKKMFEKQKIDPTSSEDFDTFSLTELRELASQIGVENTQNYTNKKLLISLIVKKKNEKERRVQIDEIEGELGYDQDEFDKYDIWTSELLKKTDTKLVEYVPMVLMDLNERLSNELRTIWK